MSILVGVLPSFTARKGLAARKRVAEAFEKYFRDGCQNEGSVLTRNRYETSAKNGVPIEDIARYEVGGAIAILVNTAPAVFWMILLVYSDPSLLQVVRKEIDSVATTSVKDVVSVRSLDITSLKADCPLLMSTYQEVLRFRSMGTSVRQVMQDGLLNDRWLLKTGCRIQMPSRIVHTDPSIWGSDVDEFKPSRFLKDETHNTDSRKRPSAAAFRAFGGGKTLCSGRHFATNEILAVVAMFVVRFDLRPSAEKWYLPKTDKTNVAAVIMEPDNDVEVEVSRRPVFRDYRWSFSLGDSDKIFAVVAEDQS